MKRTLILALLACTGCASAGMNSMCAHVNGQELTVPYVGGKTMADAYVCHVGCFGMDCPKPDYTAIANLTSDYLKAVQVDGKISTSGPGTITFTPAAK